MKKATQKIVNKFPSFKEHIHDYESVLLVEKTLSSKSEVEKTFLKLAWFFENPRNESFNLGDLYQHLDNEWLEFALEIITDYFREDTYLIQEPSYSLIKNNSDYFSLSQFADYLNQQGLNYNRQKLNLYYGRGKIPNPDLVVGGIKYWSLKTVEKYCTQEKLR